ncbi:hypothetical protein HAX54_031276 [Datura stramonium]|uniref:Uncharacterized protein n=1 Tax=Datura stramonium TaxID=4076 RepID=A0ABS8SBS1_DATST|nr:hypothetical protein [Datura stramonium]
MNKTVRLSTQEDIEEIRLTPITNTEGELGTHDENKRQEHLNTTEHLVPDGIVSGLNMPHQRAIDEQEPKLAKVQPSDEPDPSNETEQQEVQTILKGRVIDEEVLNEPGVVRLVEKLKYQEWDHLFVCLMPTVHELETGPSLKRKSHVTQLIVDLQNAPARVVSLGGENAQLKAKLKGAIDEISEREEKFLEEQMVHNSRIDKLLSLVEKTITPYSAKP